jgi:hypothetical protein
MSANENSVASISAVISENEAILALLATKPDHWRPGTRGSRPRKKNARCVAARALAGTDTNRKLHPLLDIADKT